MEKCYLSPILDIHTNEVITYVLAVNQNMEQIARILKKVFSTFPSVFGLILVSNQS